MVGGKGKCHGRVGKICAFPSQDLKWNSPVLHVLHEYTTCILHKYCINVILTILPMGNASLMFSILFCMLYD